MGYQPKQNNLKARESFGDIPEDIKDVVEQAKQRAAGINDSTTRVHQAAEELGLTLDENLILEEIEEAKSKDLGKFSSRLGMQSFMSAVSRVNAHTNMAFIDGKYFDTLQLEGVKFKMTIKDDSTFDLEEVDTCFCTDEEIARYASLFEDGKVVGWRSKAFISDFEFTTTYEDTDKNSVKLKAHIVIEPQTLYDDMIDFLNEEPTTQVATKEDTTTDEDDFEALLNQKFGSEEDIEEAKPVAKQIVAQPGEMTSRDFLAAEFLEVKRGKVDKLKKEEDGLRQLLKEVKATANLANMKIRETTDELNLLLSRIDSFELNDPANGYMIYVPPVLSSKCALEESVKEIILNKLVKMNFTNPNGFLRLFDNLLYQVRIASSNNGEITELTDYSNILPILQHFDPDGIFYDSDGKLFYEGQMDWARLNNRLIRLGFVPNATFEEMCKATPIADDEIPEIEDDPLTRGRAARTNTFVGVNPFAGMRMSANNHPQPRRAANTNDDDNDEELAGFFNDDFLFAIYEDTNGTDDLLDPKYSIAITPKSYFEQEGCMYDQHIIHLLKAKYPAINAMGNRFSEEMECSFQLADSEDFMNAKAVISLEEIIDFLCKAGLVFKSGFQDIILNSQRTSITQNVIDVINTTGNSTCII
jgi:hypothetical protein